MALSIPELQALCRDTSIAITKHAKNRFIERNIKLDDIITGILSGEIIKQYEDDKPFPSCLILGTSTNDAPIHIVTSKGDEYLYIITAYYPDESEWESDFKTRKEHSL